MSYRIGKKKFTDVDVMTAARERIRAALGMCDTLVVSFSGGKDSTVLLNIAIDVCKEEGALPVKTLFVDEEAIYPECEEYVRRVSEREEVELLWSCVPTKHRNASSRKHAWWYTWNPEEKDLWCRPMPREALGPEDLPNVPWDAIPVQMGELYGPELGSVIVLLGRRSSESLTRYRLVASRDGEDCFIAPVAHSVETKKGKMVTFPHLRLGDPIYDFTTEDVWHSIHENGWDYCDAYDRMSKLGIPMNSQRLAPPYGEEPGKTLWTYKLAWPQLWDKMQSRVPGADAHARYCNTELYSTATKNLKPAEGETWEEYTMRLLLKWPKKTRKKVSHNIKLLIDRHIKKLMQAGEKEFKIPNEQTHPLTGLSWKVLATIASRGVLKARTMGMISTRYVKQEKPTAK